MKVLAVLRPTLPTHSALRAGTTRRLKPVRLSLRTLLALVAVACVAGGYYANRFHQQRQILDMVARRGGHVGYGQGTPHALRQNSPLDEYLIREIEEVTLFFAPIEDADLAVLRHCRQLKRLNLDYTPIGDGGLAHVVPISSLVRLEVKQTQVTDAGMALIAQLPKLEALLLDGVALTDIGLEELETLPSLRYLSVRQTNVSPAGLERFRQANPDCYVIR